MKTAVRWISAAVCALAASPAAAAADLIITNAKVFTAVARQPYAQAVAIEGERITFVGQDRLWGRGDPAILMSAFRA